MRWQILICNLGRMWHSYNLIVSCERVHTDVVKYLIGFYMEMLMFILMFPEVNLSDLFFLVKQQNNLN